MEGSIFLVGSPGISAVLALGESTRAYRLAPRRRFHFIRLFLELQIKL